MYLIGRSMELSLKAYILYNKVTLKDLSDPKKLGHDLQKCLTCAEGFGSKKVVTLENLEMDAFNALNAMYRRKELEYSVTGFKIYPLLSQLRASS